MIGLTKSKRGSIIIVLVVGIVLIGGSAYLYWRSKPLHNGKQQTPQPIDLSTKASAGRQLQEYQATPLPDNATPQQQYQYHLTSAQLLAGQGMYAEAETELQHVKDTGLPLSADYYELLGSTYRRDGKKQDAIAAYQQELVILKQNPEQNSSRIDSITSMIKGLQS